MAGTVEQKLAAQGIVLPEPRAAMANYVGFVRTGNLLFISGQVCANAEGKLVAKGKLGAGVTTEQGYEAAKTCGVNLLAQIKAALGGNFAIECDIQLTSDGEAMVHHDNALGRLTEGSGALLRKTAAELKAVKFKNTAERMMTLGDLCDLVAGRVPLVIEVKSHFDVDRRLVERMADRV